MVNCGVPRNAPSALVGVQYPRSVAYLGDWRRNVTCRCTESVSTFAWSWTVRERTFNVCMKLKGLCTWSFEYCKIDLLNADPR